MKKIFEVNEYNSEGLDKAIKQIEKDEIACGLICNGKIIATATGKGIKPLIELCLANANLAEEAVLADKIIGRAASFIAIHFGIKAVYGETMSKGGAELLSEHNIAVAQKILANEIRNRTNTDVCPMDKAVKGMSKADEAFQCLLEKIKH